MVPVDQGDTDTLLPIIQDYILPGTTMVSLSISGNLTHLTESLNFVDPVKFAHTKTM